MVKTMHYILQACQERKEISNYRLDFLGSFEDDDLQSWIQQPAETAL